MKEIFQRKLFWAILVILLLAVFVYPPFMFRVGSQEGSAIMKRTWGWIVSPPQVGNMLMEVDLKTLLVESIIAILLTIAVCLIPFRKIGAGFRLAFTVFKMVLISKGFWLMIVIISFAIMIYPPFIKEGKQRIWEIPLQLTLEESSAREFPKTGETIYILSDEITGRKIKFAWRDVNPPTNEDLKKIFHSGFKVVRKKFVPATSDRKLGFIFLPPTHRIPLEDSINEISLKVLEEKMLLGDEKIEDKSRSTKLKNFREMYPQYNNLSDYELANSLWELYYSDMPFGEFALKVGLDIKQALKEINEERKMRIDKEALIAELAVGFGLSFLIMLMIFGMKNKRKY
jgi:hypothetical protein